MDVTLSQDLPSELIDLFIANVASNNNGSYSIRQRRHDLAACGLVCRAFYLPSRKHLFENVTLTVKYGEREPRSLRKLREILSANPILRDQIYHLVISDPTPAGAPGWRRPGRTIFGEENLPHILRLLPALRSLCISAVQDVYWSSLNRELISALRSLRFLCLYLRRLELRRLRGVPVGFIHQWNEVVDIELKSVDLVDENLERAPPNTHDVHPTILESFIPYQHLEHLSLSGDFNFPKPVQEAISTQLCHLRSLHIMLIPFWQNKETWSQGWSLVIRTSRYLNRLSLHFFFNQPPLSWSCPVSIRHFPYLHSIELHDTNRQGLLTDINRFLTPQKTPVQVQSILLSIDLFHDPGHTFLSFQPEQWMLLDEACSNTQLYQDLHKVEISINFFHEQRHTKEWEKSILDTLENCSSRLLPLLSSSKFVSLEFVVTITFLHVLRITWRNGIVSLGTGFFVS